MDTNDLVDRVATDLAGLTGREMIRLLDGAITDSVTSFVTLTDAPENCSTGTIVEIDRELMMVTNYLPSGSVYSHVVSRGYAGTTAAAHADAALVRYDPMVSKARILAAMHDAIASFDVGIYKVATVDLSFAEGQVVHDLTGETGVVAKILMAYRMDGAGGMYGVEQPGLELLRNQPTSTFPSGYAVRITGGASYGEATIVRVVYATTYTVADLALDSTSTLSANLESAVAFKAKAEIAGDLELSRLQMSAQGQVRHPEDVPPTSLLRASQAYEAQYHERLSAERDLLAGRHGVMTEVHG